MKPLALWPAASRRRLLGVFTDIDDTLTTGGVVPDEALAALIALKEAGVPVIAITGRPAGWSRPFALQWPVDAVVAENGAVAWVPAPAGLRKLYSQDGAVRAAHAVRLAHIAGRILREVPGATLARDSAGRETDIAIDHGEFERLPTARIAEVLALMRGEGMNATVSSIHVNGWFGDHGKLTGARWMVRELYGRALDAESDAWAYVGDSANDVSMFRHFQSSIGVANILPIAAGLEHLPRYVTRLERGAGFAEVADFIIEAKSARSPCVAGAGSY